MTLTDFQFVANLIRDRSGLVLSEEKAYLLESRLMPLTRKAGMKSLDELVAVVRAKRDDGIVKDIVEAMTTNESLFFRDTKPFQQLRDIVFPKLTKSRASSRKIRIWCAACSSGQEPYSIAMTIKEAGALYSGWNFEIVATDLSTVMLDKAKSGMFSQFEVQRGLPITLLVKYFNQDGDKWKISSELISMVRFSPFNLLSNPAALGEFDIVFCRNVLIYFDRDTKARVLDGIGSIMPDDGVLYLGGAETVLGLTEIFRPVSDQRGMYQLTRGAGMRMSA
ncbi:MAG: protein-glutamate O-methyltransferase [Alphaproteobacteria bacterium]